MSDNKLAEVEQAIRDAISESNRTAYEKRTESYADTIVNGLLPVISRLLDAAHADALRAAALEVCVYCQRGVPMKLEDYHDNSAFTSDASSECFKYPFCDGARIRRLTQERARLERELEVVRAQRALAHKIKDNVPLNPTYFWQHILQGFDREIADLEAKLKALEGQSKNKT